MSGWRKALVKCREIQCHCGEDIQISDLAFAIALPKRSLAFSGDGHRRAWAYREYELRR